MMEQLPEGKSIGWMQAPPQWIFSHTLRFAGIVRIVIHDGEGFILINRGKVLGYYFRHGKIELRGNAALDYFNFHPSVEFNLSRYTPEEMAEALGISGIDSEPEGRKHEVSPAVPAPEPVIIRTQEIPPASKKPEPPSGEKPVDSVEENAENSGEESPEPVVEESPKPADESLYEPSQPRTTGEPPASMDTVSLEERDMRIASQIKNFFHIHLQFRYLLGKDQFKSHILIVTKKRPQPYFLITQIHISLFS